MKKYYLVLINIKRFCLFHNIMLFIKQISQESCDIYIIKLKDQRYIGNNSISKCQFGAQIFKGN